MMKIAAMFGTSMLALALTTTAAAKVRPDHDEGHGHGSQEQHGNEQHGNGQHGNGRQDHPMEHGRAAAPQHANEHQARGPAHAPQARQRDVWQRQRAQSWQHEHQTWGQRGGYHGYRIPEDRFRASFGRGHWFRIARGPIVVVDGHPRFQYSGFWFTLVDPWPETWSRTWYDSDDVYVDYVNDGYYLFDRQHPGVSIAVNVSF